MAQQRHFDGKRTAGSHTTVITGAGPILDVLMSTFPDIRINNGFIDAGIGARNQSVKLVTTPSMTQMTIVTKATKQTFMIYGELTAEQAARALKSHKKSRGFIINYEKE